MSVNIFVAATLRKYIKGYEPEKGICLDIPEGTTVREMLDILKIPHEEVKIIMVNGIHSSLEKKLKGDERIGLFPAVGGG